MPKPLKSKQKRCLSSFMMMRKHGALLAEKRARETKVRELTKTRDDARERAKASGKHWDNEQTALGMAERGVIFINKTILRLEKELNHAQS